LNLFEVHIEHGGHAHIPNPKYKITIFMRH